MPGLVEKLKPIFAVSGRASRLDYWRTQVRLALATAVLLTLTVLATMAGGWLGAVPCLLFLPVVAAGVAVAVRRLHDRGKPGWWVLVFGVGPYALSGVASGLYASGSALILAAPLLALAAVILSIWAWVELGFLRGARGDNRYGAEPARR
ncbi:DUF805 domain-containing protein [Caulobacter endophyticus]|uniref:DUF805 domain-containing protein n=1 Tax=Caulobacter endophyticus TaxID=2172652 RepID=UPI002410877F|nr:DUF805 domain-containing protein [Caulobacter endophyticus]MDG2528284.1 DUF805 domain-containing protein [Caulobacter endophyticus]